MAKKQPTLLIPDERIEKAILLIREQKILLDSDLAELYGVETKTLVRTVKHKNLDRFPEDFLFQLNEAEFDVLRCQLGTSSTWGGRRYPPYAFTEQGVAMLSSVLRSARAVQVNIAIMRAFVRLRELLGSHKELARQLAELETKYDENFRIVFEAIRQLMTPLPVEKKKRIGFHLDPENPEDTIVNPRSAANLTIGYNTNGFAHHRLEDAIAILADLGYRSVALTLDYHALNPYDAAYREQLEKIADLLQQRGMCSVIETGARFLLDPLRKHQPTLLSAAVSERERRLDFLRRAIDCAQALNADAVSFWSGRALTDDSADLLMTRLVDGCRQLCDYAAARNVRLAFEPEPGMFIDVMPRFAELHARVAHPAFGLTLDVGHLHCLGEVPMADPVRRWQAWLWNIHIEDMRRGVHDHLPFGEGEIDFPPLLAILQEIGYSGGLHVELSRQSHDAVETARRSFAFLHALTRPGR